MFSGLWNVKKLCPPPHSPPSLSQTSAATIIKVNLKRFNLALLFSRDLKKNIKKNTSLPRFCFMWKENLKKKENTEKERESERYGEEKKKGGGG